MNNSNMKAKTLSKIILSSVVLSTISTSAVMAHDHHHSAEPNVKIYGLVDFGYTLRHDRNENGKLNNISKTNSRFNGSQAAENRLGFNASEDLGNGTKVFFSLERGFNLDTGVENGGFNLHAYVGFQNDKYGTIYGGTMHSLQYSFLRRLDPFRSGTIGSHTNVADLGYVAMGNLFDHSVFSIEHINNALSYESPKFGNFSFSALYANNPFGDDSSTRDAANNNLYELNLLYSQAKWNIGLNYHYLALGKPENQQRSYKNLYNIAVGGAYDFDFVKLSAFVSHSKISAKNNLAAFNNKKSLSQTNYLLGAVAPFGKHAVKGSLNYSHNSKNQYGDAWQLAVGYDYNFSKRTNFYAVYSYINADKSKADGSRLGRQSVTVSDAGNDGGATVNGLFSGYKQGFQVGIKHRF